MMTTIARRRTSAGLAAATLTVGVVALGAVGSGTAYAAGPSYYCRSTPVFSHILITQFLNPTYQGQVSHPRVGRRQL